MQVDHAADATGNRQEIASHRRKRGKRRREEQRVAGSALIKFPPESRTALERNHSKRLGGHRLNAIAQFIIAGRFVSLVPTFLFPLMRDAKAIK